MATALELPGSIAVTNPEPVVATDGPWDSTADACTHIPEAIRYKGMTVKVIKDGAAVEYWWESGIKDGDFVEKAVQSDWEESDPSKGSFIKGKPTPINFNVYNQKSSQAVVVNTTAKTVVTPGNILIAIDSENSYIGKMVGNFSVGSPSAKATLYFSIGNREISKETNELTSTGDSLPFFLDYTINLNANKTYEVSGVLILGDVVQSFLILTGSTTAGNTFAIAVKLTAGTLTVNSSYLHRNVN